MRSILSVLLLLVFTSLAIAQQVGRKPPEPGSGPPRQSAEVVLSASLIAHGGMELNEVLRVQMTGTATVGKTSQPITISASLDGSSRTDYGNPATRSIVTTSSGTYEIRDGKTVSRPAHAMLYEQFDALSILGLRTKYASGADRGLMGNGSVGGRETLRVHAGTDDRKMFYGRRVQDELDAEFDTATGLLAAVHRQGFADDSFDVSFTTSYAFSEYREVQGLMLPFRIDRYLNGKLKETITVSSYTINPALSPSLFER
jgi:hypothetical protein